MHLPGSRRPSRRPFGRHWLAVLVPAGVLAVAYPLAGAAAVALVIIVAGLSR